MKISKFNINFIYIFAGLAVLIAAFYLGSMQSVNAAQCSCNSGEEAYAFFCYNGQIGSTIDCRDCDCIYGSPGHWFCYHCGNYQCRVIPSPDDPDKPCDCYCGVNCENRGWLSVCPPGETCTKRNFTAGCDTGCGWIRGCDRDCYRVVDSPPQVVSIDVINKSCSNGWSGSSTYGGANNPADIRVVAHDSNGANDITRVFIGLAPDEADNIGDAFCTEWEHNLGKYMGLFYDLNGNYIVDVIEDPNTPGAPWPNCPWDYASRENTRFTIESKSFTRSGNDVIINLRVRFNNTFPEGQYKFFGMVQDNSGKLSCIGNPALGGCWDEKSGWGLDFDSPSGTANVGVEPDDKLKITWNINDNLSGIKSVDRNCGTTLSIPSVCTCSGSGCYASRDSWYVRFIFGSLGDDPVVDPVTNPGKTWTYNNYDDVSGLVQSGDIRYKADVVDNACNTGTVTSGPTQLGGAWTRTLLGDTYAFSGYSYGIPSLTDERDNIAYNICSYKSAGAGFSKSTASRSGSIVSAYTDNNKSLPNGFYDYLHSLVEENAIKNSFTINPLSNFADLTDGVFEWTGNNGNLSLPAGSRCKGKALIFVPGTLSITPDFTNFSLVSPASDKGCMFIVKSNIVIRPGGAGVRTYVPSSPDSSGGYSTKSVKYDLIEAFLVSNGSVTIQSDGNRDQLQIKGGVVSGSAFFRRSLGLSNNTVFAAERVEYDGRYLELMKGYLGIPLPVSIKEFAYVD